MCVRVRGGVHPMWTVRRGASGWLGLVERGEMRGSEGGLVPVPANTTGQRLEQKEVGSGGKERRNDAAFHPSSPLFLQ